VLSSCGKWGWLILCCRKCGVPHGQVGRLLDT